MPLRIQINLSGDNGGNWIVDIRDRNCTVTEGQSSTPDLVINAAPEIWARIATKETNPVLALMSRKLRVKGDLSLLRKFDDLFPLPL